MAGLYFLGIKKSTIKKIPPFNYIFDWRDRRNYNVILHRLSNQYKIDDFSLTELVLHFSINGGSVRLVLRKFPASDLSVLNQVFEGACYRPIIDKMLPYFERNNPLRIIDAGANVGYSCVYFKTFFPNASIVAVEPEDGNAKQLHKNLSINGYHVTQLVQGALWYQKAFLEVVRNFRDNREASFTVQETTRSTSIRGYSFEELLANQGWDNADLVKIDIEGGERFLFDTQEKADAILKHTKFLAIEIHDEFNIRETIYQHLRRNNYEYFEFDDLTLAINKDKVF